VRGDGRGARAVGRERPAARVPAPGGWVRTGATPLCLCVCVGWWCGGEDGAEVGEGTLDQDPLLSKSQSFG
jgi:hypothetical protein